jgi:putative intracellular protease/amidase
MALCEVRSEDVELLILPGGEMWENEAYPRELLDTLVETLVENDTPVAAICGATIALARAGVLDRRRHTSNLPDYLATHAAEYRGAGSYVDAPAVRDKRVITASGLAPVDFARAIFAELGVFSEHDEALWFEMYKHGRIPAGMCAT